MILKKGWLSLLFIVILLGSVIYANQANLSERDVRPEVGFVAPDFSLLDVNMQEVSLNQYRGRPVFINFWASWCPPCKEEMPVIESAYQEYVDEIVFLGVNLTYSDTKEDAIYFMTSNDYQMPILFDDTGAVTKLYRANNIPTSYFIDANGVITAKHLGAMSSAQIESYIKSALGGK